MRPILPALLKISMTIWPTLHALNVGIDTLSGSLPQEPGPLSALEMQTQEL